MSSRRSPVSLPNRAAQGRLLAGVCETLARLLAIDVTLLRLAFALLTFAWGLGALLYGVLWLVLPPPNIQPRDVGESVRHNFRTMRNDVTESGDFLLRAWNRQSKGSWPRPLDRRWIALSLIAGGALIFLISIGAFSWLTPVRGLSLAVIVAGTAILLRMGDT